MSDDWRWEGNVAQAVARALADEGWSIVAIADTASQEHGVDVLAERHGRQLAVEVKGFPSTVYQRGRLAGQPKPTLPASQGRQWVSHALLGCLLTRSHHPDAEIAMALPDAPTYRSLLTRCDGALRRLGIGVYVVSPDVVERRLDHRLSDW